MQDSTGEKAPEQKENLAFCRGSPSSVQQSPQQCMPVKRLPETRESVIKKNQREQCRETAQSQEQCLFPLVTLEQKPWGTGWSTYEGLASAGSNELYTSLTDYKIKTQKGQTVSKWFNYITGQAQ